MIMSTNQDIMKKLLEKYHPLELTVENINQLEKDIEEKFDDVKDAGISLLILPENSRGEIITRARIPSGWFENKRT